MTDAWVWGDTPGESGWYATLYCWDAQEGVHIGPEYWTGDAWARKLPIVGYAGPFDCSDTAYKYAVDNDPDGV